MAGDITTSPALLPLLLLLAALLAVLGEATVAADAAPRLLLEVLLHRSPFHCARRRPAGLARQ
jgi:hypothetical protein